MGNSGLKWDGTVSAGSIIAAVAIVIPLIGVGYVSVSKIAAIETTMKEQGVRFEDRIGKVEDQIGLIREDLARREALANEVRDLRDRVAKIEGQR
jgi:hypothetical protein